MSDASPLAGFSLIELMIALVIASILSAVAIPAYRDYLLRVNIPEATGGLLLTAMRLEQYYQDHQSYAPSVLPTAGAANPCGIALPPVGQFTFDCRAAQGGQSFLLTASGTAGGAMAAFTYTLDQQGQASTTALPEAWGQIPATCWIAKRGGQC